MPGWGRTGLILLSWWRRGVLDMAADRGAYIDQSQSLNIHMIDATTAKLSGPPQANVQGSHLIFSIPDF